MSKVYVVSESSEKFGNTVAGVFYSFDKARGSSAGAAYLRGGNYGYREHYGYGAHIGMTREEMDMLHDAEMRKTKEDEAEGSE